jgi:hypothetical protein
MVTFISTDNWIDESDLRRLSEMIGVRSSKKYSFGDKKWSDIKEKIDGFIKDGLYIIKNKNGGKKKN